MPWYNDLRPLTDENKQKYALLFPQMTKREKIRCIDKLLILRQGLQASIRPKITDKNILIASWNIKEFGHTTQRRPEAFFYIAEILNAFDLIAVQEVKSGLKDLQIIMRLLGNDWAYQINDITDGTDGNSERSAYIYNKKRVQLPGISGEITLWDTLTKNSTIKQLKRTPYITGFQSGWKRMMLVNVHLHPSAKPKDIAYRKEEVDLLVAALKHKVKKKQLWSENLIVVGDFNFYRATATNAKDQPAIDVFTQAKFRQIDALDGVDTNASKTEAYDRMFFHVNEYFKIAADDSGDEVGGVFNPFNFVFTDADWSSYKSFMRKDYTGTKDMSVDANLKKYYANPWRKNQLSDHFPIWTEIIIDSSDSFLEEKKKVLETPS